MNDHIPDPTKMINDGGPAFPRTGADGHTSPQSGMALRDYFAAAALQGLIANGGCPTWDDDAKAAYAAADAMLKAREAKL
jgi:hypothetical protein